MTFWKFIPPPPGWVLRANGVGFEQTIELDESEVIVHEDSDSEAASIRQLEGTDSS